MKFCEGDVIMCQRIMKDILEVDYKVVGKDMRLCAPHNDLSVEIIQTWSKGGFFMVKDNIFPIDSGSVFIINAIENHFSNPEKIDTYVRSKLIVSKEYFTDLMKVLGLEDTVWGQLEECGGLHFELLANSNAAIVIDRYFQSAAQLYEPALTGKGEPSDPLTKARISINLVQILMTLFLEHPAEKSVLDNPQKTLNLITEYINEHTTTWEALSLEEISSSLHISRSYISHLFKKTTGQPLMQFVSECRIAESKKLLINSDMKVQEISERLNYSSSTVFCKTFKKIVGKTPNEYRAQNR